MVALPLFAVGMFPVSHGGWVHLKLEDDCKQHLKAILFHDLEGSLMLQGYVMKMSEFFFVAFFQGQNIQDDTNVSLVYQVWPVVPV